MKESNALMYCRVMEKIKKRQCVIFQMYKGKKPMPVHCTTLESMALQIRIILELIAMATLVANEQKYREVYSDFAKEWRVKRLLKNLKEIHPNFYPQPLIAQPDGPNGRYRFTLRKSDYLTKEEFPHVYKKCSAILHARNPFDQEIDYGYYVKEIPKWWKKITNLLECHQFFLLGNTDCHRVDMEVGPDGRVELVVGELVQAPDDK